MNKRQIEILKNKWNLHSRDEVCEFISRNPEKFEIENLRHIAEYVNNDRTETAAFYTDEIILNNIIPNLPNFDKKKIRILEPAVGIGNFLPILFEKYVHHKEVIIDILDVDKSSLKICEILTKMQNPPLNFKIYYHHVDYLKFKPNYNYDLIIGNPPFKRVSKKEIEKISYMKFNQESRNLADLFLQKSLTESRYVSFVMPKYFLSNADFENTRKQIKKKIIKSIIDFGEKGFKGVLIETINIIIENVDKNKENDTKIVSFVENSTRNVKQEYLTSDFFPNWMLYRNDFFDNLSQQLQFDIFKCVRDRSINNKDLKNDGDIRVLKSRNISRDGREIVDIEGYDKFIDKKILETKSIKKYLDDSSVFLSPNMTYFPRLIRKPKNTIVNGSIAILIPKNNISISENDREFLSSMEFEKFYRIARNRSSRSLNIDKQSIFYFGKRMILDGDN